MPILPNNFDDVADDFKPIAAGKRTLLIVEPPEEGTSLAGKPKLIFTYRVQDDSEDNGRMIKDHISLEMLTKIKRIAMSAGVTPGPDGLDTDELTGKLVEAIVTNQSVPDRDDPTNEDLITIRSRIRSYVVNKD